MPVTPTHSLKRRWRKSGILERAPHQRTPRILPLADKEGNHIAPDEIFRLELTHYEAFLKIAGVDGNASKPSLVVTLTNLNVVSTDRKSTASKTSDFPFNNNVPATTL